MSTSKRQKHDSTNKESTNSNKNTEKIAICCQKTISCIGFKKCMPATPGNFSVWKSSFNLDLELKITQKELKSALVENGLAAFSFIREAVCKKMDVQNKDFVIVCKYLDHSGNKCTFLTYDCSYLIHYSLFESLCICALSVQQLNEIWTQHSPLKIEFPIFSVNEKEEKICLSLHIPPSEDFTKRFFFFIPPEGENQITQILDQSSYDRTQAAIDSLLNLKSLEETFIVVNGEAFFFLKIARLKLWQLLFNLSNFSYTITDQTKTLVQTKDSKLSRTEFLSLDCKPLTKTPLSELNQLSGFMIVNVKK